MLCACIQAHVYETVSQRCTVGFTYLGFLFLKTNGKALNLGIQPPFFSALACVIQVLFGSRLFFAGHVPLFYQGLGLTYRKFPPSI